jgi:hypothetical protein
VEGLEAEHFLDSVPRKRFAFGHEDAEENSDE